MVLVERQLQQPPPLASLSGSRSAPSLAARTPSRLRSTLSTPAGRLLSEQLLVHLHRAERPRQSALAKNPQAIPLHASGALGGRPMSNTQLPTIVGGLLRAQRAKFLDRDLARDSSQERYSKERGSLYLPVLPCTSLYLPASPCISPYLPVSPRISQGRYSKERCCSIRASPTDRPCPAPPAPASPAPLRTLSLSLTLTTGPDQERLLESNFGGRSLTRLVQHAK